MRLSFYTRSGMLGLLVGILIGDVVGLAYRGLTSSALIHLLALVCASCVLADTLRGDI